MDTGYKHYFLAPGRVLQSTGERYRSVRTTSHWASEDGFDKFRGGQLKEYKPVFPFDCRAVYQYERGQHSALVLWTPKNQFGSTHKLLTLSELLISVRTEPQSAHGRRPRRAGWCGKGGSRLDMLGLALADGICPAASSVVSVQSEKGTSRSSSSISGYLET